MLSETVTRGSTQLRTGPVRHISLLPSHVAVGEIWGVEGGAGPELTTESTDKTALNPVIPDDNKRIILAHAPTCSPNPVARAGTWMVLSRADNDARQNEGTWPGAGFAPLPQKEKKNLLQ